MNRLNEYNKKRNFDKTQEPKGILKKENKKNIFVIQHHMASKDHYDFRMEVDGVLKSWAVPKGFSYNTKDKRLAVMVEDHPLSYHDFEGVIPPLQYGAGLVMLYDTGYYESNNIKNGLKKGIIKFELFGKRVKGKWSLIRFKDNNWLLVKERDNIYVDLNKFKRSIKTNRTMDEIKNGLDSITITSPDKIIEKKSMLTKLDIVNYYKKVSVRMMPFLNNRLISTIRYPNGNSNDSFFKKHFENNKYLGKKVVISNKKKNDYYFIKDLNGLMYEVQMNSYEFHIWSSNVKAINKPDIMVFDLDPDEKLNINKVRDGVMCLKNVLDQLGLKSFLKTSGGKGYHVFVPFTSFESWSSFSLFAKNISLLLEEKYPDMFTCNMSKEKRKNKIFIDWYRNKKSSTSVAPYSLRIRKKITVSMPIKWSELYKIKPGDITIDIAIKRLKRIDPWKDFFSIKQ